MRKLIIAAVFVMISMSAGAFYAALEAETRLIHSSYIENSVFEILSQSDELSSVEAFEKLTLRLDKEIDEIKFYFEGRFYLRPLESNFDYTVDNAYFRIASGPFVAYLGKQRMKWGTGYTWNPVDLLQPGRNVFDPEEDLEGFYAARMEYSNPFITPSVILSVEPKSYDRDFAENFKAAVRLYKLVGAMDIFVSGIYCHNSLQNIGAALSWDAGLFVINAEYSAARYMDDSLSLIHSLGERGGEDISHSWLAGINRQIGEEMFLNIEYYHNGAGLDNYMFDRFIEGLETEPGGLAYMGVSMKKDYMSGTFSFVWDGKISMGITSIYGMNDGSIYLYPVVEYVENQNFTLRAGYFMNLSETENSQGYYAMPVRGAAEIGVIAYF